MTSSSRTYTNVTLPSELIAEAKPAVISYM